jgi:hypothetical protein
MPIRKFRSVEEMPDAPAAPPLRAENLKAAFDLSELARRLRPWRLPPGVRKFRSVAEAHAWRDEWERTSAAE